MTNDPSNEGAVPPKTTRRRCPICREPAVDRYRPFCSARCADVDLGRWFTEAYRIPGADAEEAEDEPPAEPPRRPSDDG